MKKFTVAILALLMAVCGAGAKKMSDLKIYINPGHGGYTSNDRPIQIYPFESNDTAGYWESKSNLYKGLHMYHILDSLGAKPYLSRIKNTEADDRSLAGIAAEANSLGVDLFFSIHSNAGESVNYPLMLYRENTIGTPRYPENVTLSKILWHELFSSKLPVWTHTSEYVCGDLDFYKNQWQGGLGVLRTLYVVGLLSEGSMHEHRPEAYRLMNDDYWWLEAWHFVHAIMKFYDTEDRFVTGNVAGVVYDNHNLREKDMPVSFHYYGRDQFRPLNFATVELRDQAGNVVQKRTTDDMYNGVFVFRNVAPGNYKLYATRDDFYPEVTDVTVTADKVTYQDMPLTMRRAMPLEITSFSPNVKEGEEVSCSTSIDFTFNTDIDVESFEKAVTITPAVDGRWEYSDSYTKAKFIPTLSFEQSTVYTVSVDASAKHPDTYYSHPQLNAPLQFSFATKGRNRLELIDRFPTDGADVHYLAPTLEFRFDAAIDYSNIYNQITVKDSNGKTLTVNKRTSKFNQLSNGYGNAVIALPNLTPGMEYSVTLSGDLRDREQLPLVNDVNMHFTAIDATVDLPNTVVEDFEKAVNFAYNESRTEGISNVLPTAARSTSVRFDGAATGRFTYRFADSHGGNIEWDYTGEPALYNTGDIIGMYVNGDFNNHELWVMLTSGTNTKYTKLCDLNFIGWHYKEVSLDNLESDFCPFIFSGLRLVQVESPITQNGNFAIDNIAFRSGQGGVNDIVTDGSNITVSATAGNIIVSGANGALVEVFTVDGRCIASDTADCSIAAEPGFYLVKVGNVTTKVTVK